MRHGARIADTQSQSGQWPARHGFSRGMRIILAITATYISGTYSHSSVVERSNDNYPELRQSNSRARAIFTFGDDMKVSVHLMATKSRADNRSPSE